MQSALRSTPTTTFRHLSRSFVSSRQLHVQTPAALTMVANRQLNKNKHWMQTRFYADKVVKVPQMAESISEGTLKQWVKSVGDFVNQDDEVATIETDKIDVTVNAPASGTIVEVYAQEEDNVSVGADFFKLELGDAPKEGTAAPKKEEASSKKEEKEEAPKKNDDDAPKQKEQQQQQQQQETPAPEKKSTTPPPPSSAPSSASNTATPTTEEGKTIGSRNENRVKMNRMRLRIAERLKQSQDTAASLTTFNEVDMTNLMGLRADYKDAVLKKHGVKFGFMSAFVKASACALTDIPAVNASIDGNEIVYHDFVDISVAVSTPKGLVTPVLRNVEDMDFLDIEKTVAALGKKARDNKITIEDMAGGTFTISNGGIFGSLMGTPIINLPQTAILGMHGIKDRVVAVNGKVEIRPMMYIALTYDHRLVDGREAVQFLVRIKELVEDPRRLLLNV